MLPHVQGQQQLTHHSLMHSLQADVEGNPAAAAYAALTASSKLHHLNICGCTLAAGAWQHMFAAGGQLPHLRSVCIDSVMEASGGYVPAPPGSRLVSCCPGLQSLDMQYLQYSVELLAPLQLLSRLQELRLAAQASGGSAEGFKAVYPKVLCKFTQLRALTLLCPPCCSDQVLMHLTTLQHLASLLYGGQLSGGVYALMVLQAQVG